MSIIVDIITQPIKVIDVTEKGINWIAIMSYVYSTIATGFITYDKFKRPKLYGKVVSKIISQVGSYTYKAYNSETITKNGQQYILRMSISCMIKSLNYKDVKAFVTYKNNLRLETYIYWSEFTDLNFVENNANVKKRLKLPTNEFLLFNNVIEVGKTNLYYLNFIVPQVQGVELFKKLELEFVKPDNRKVIVEVMELPQNQMFLDDGLFVAC